MENKPAASEVLARRYPLTCIPEDYASSLLATQKRREELKPENPPSQAEAGLGTVTLRRYQSFTSQNLRCTMSGGTVRKMPWSLMRDSGANEVDHAA